MKKAAERLVQLRILISISPSKGTFPAAGVWPLFLPQGLMVPRAAPPKAAAWAIYTRKNVDVRDVVGAVGAWRVLAPSLLSFSFAQQNLSTAQVRLLLFALRTPASALLRTCLEKIMMLVQLTLPMCASLSLNRLQRDGEMIWPMMTSVRFT